MNSLLTLIEDLEQKSKMQQQSTGEMLKTIFGRHEKSVRAELNESRERVSAAILDHGRKLSLAMSQHTKDILRVVSQAWLTTVLAFVPLITSNAGVLQWQGQQILNSYTSIREQKGMPEKLNTRMWGVRYQEDNQGRFPVLPEDMKAGTNWASDNGRKNGIRLMQK